MELFAHQSKHVAEHWDKDHHGLWWDLGTGKTAAVLHELRQLFFTHAIDGAIVVGPAEVYLNWLDQIRIHTPELSAVAWQSRYPKRSVENLESMAGVRTMAYIVNVEALSRQKPKVMESMIMFMRSRKRIAFIVDEGSCIKSPAAHCTKNVLWLGKYAAYRRLLNGKPGIESPFDTWAQLEFLKPGCTGMNYYMFTKTYGIWQRKVFGPRSFDKVVAYRGVEQIRRLLEEHGTFIRKDECLDLPEKLYETLYIDLPDDLMTQYAIFKKKKFIELNGDTVTSGHAFDVAIQLHNLSTGFVRHDDKSVQWLSSAKVDALMDFVERVNGKIVVYCNSRAALKMLEQRFQDTYGVTSFGIMHGDIEPDKRMAYVKLFQEDPGFRFLLANQAVAGRGLTLTAASYIVYFRNSYSLEERVQSEDRAHRIGQTKNVTIVDIVSRNTIDERVIMLLNRKMDVASMLLDVVREECEDEATV